MFVGFEGDGPCNVVLADVYPPDSTYRRLTTCPVNPLPAALPLPRVSRYVSLRQTHAPCATHLAVPCVPELQPHSDCISRLEPPLTIPLSPSLPQHILSVCLTQPVPSSSS